MTTEWIVIGVGFLSILVLMAPLLLAPYVERWDRREDRRYTGFWEE